MFLSGYLKRMGNYIRLDVWCSHENKMFAVRLNNVIHKYSLVYQKYILRKGI